MKSELPLPEKWDGTAESKARLHDGCRRVFRAVAAELGLKKSEFEVRSNEMGEAIGGFVYLDTDTFYMQVSGGYGFHVWDRFSTAEATKALREASRVDSCVTVCRVTGRTDYACTKGDDVVLDWELLWDPAKLVTFLRLEGIVS